ncbi:MAG: type I polyketide synthase, partial [Cyclobacteriaceae bacterium]
MTRIDILRSLQEKKISQEEAFKALKQLNNKPDPVQSERVTQTTHVDSVDRKATTDDAAVAIIGLSGRFPGAENAEQFWQNIKEGVDSITEIPETRWSVTGHYDSDKTSVEKTYSKWSGLVKDIEYFDPLFFNLSPREASFIDPQQRLFLEECWKTFEDAGLSPEVVTGSKCGVYVGAAEGDYMKRLKNETTMPYTLIGNSSAILSSRISYLLDLKGPSMSINTACSGSLVAIHLARQSILSGDCDMALAGGVYVHTEADLHVQTSKAGMLSEDGRCKAFDQSGNGFVPGEGVGVVLLKKLAQAVKDGDHIYGMIRGSKINQDGSTNGITAPSAESQRNLEIACYEEFKIDPSEISYIECHGTGTKLGDPIEIDALTNSFRKFTDQQQFCAIGSVKTNIGHALSAAGVAGVIKVLMSMKYRQLAPSLHFNTPNEHIDFRNSPFFVNTTLNEWKPVNNKRLAAISSFGFSGTNAHLILEEYSVGKTQTANQPPMIVPVSARSEKQLDTYVRDLMNHLIKNKEELDEVAYTLQTGRKHHDHRVAFLTDDLNSLIRQFDSYLNDNTSEGMLANKGEITSKVASTEKKPVQIARNWVNGQRVDWSMLYREIPAKVSLPTYPFEKVRCWIERKIDQVANIIVPAIEADQK